MDDINIFFIIVLYRCRLPYAKTAFISLYYRFIAFAPSAPAIAEATAMITFKMISQVVFLIVIVLSSSNLVRNK